MNGDVNRSTHLMCRAVRGFGPDPADPAGLPALLANHATSCLRCQAEAARHRRLRRSLGQLAERVDPAPGYLAHAVADAIGRDGDAAPGSRPYTRRVATFAGATAAAASAVAVALWRRSRAVA